MKRWLKKWWLLLSAIALLTAGGALIFGPKPVAFRVGSPLPKGPVTPKVLVEKDLGILLAPDGSMWVWGGETLGSYDSILGTKRAPLTPVQIGTNTTWRRIATTGHGILGIKADGSLWALGWNIHSTLLAPSKGHFLIPFRIGTETNWLDISAAGGHVLALKRDGSLWGWGSNWAGQTGSVLPSRETTTPTRIGVDNDWSKIAASAATSLALKSDGTIWAWGQDVNGFGKYGRIPTLFDTDTNWTSVVPGLNHIMGLRTDGTIWNLGYTSFSPVSSGFAQVGSDSDWVEVIAAFHLFFARKQDNSWWVAGGSLDQMKRLGGGVMWNRTMGSRAAGEPVPVPFPLQAWAMGMSSRSVVVLAPDGNLWTWGQAMGERPRMARFAPVIRLINRAAKILGAGGEWIELEEYPNDESPRLLWKLPESVARSLGNKGSK